MSDAVALNGGGNEEEFRDDAYDTNTSTIRLMLSQQELEGDGEIGGVAEIRDTAVPCWLALTKCLAILLAILGLIYGPWFGLIFAFTMTNPTLAWLLGAACLSVWMGTVSWITYSLIGRCRREPRYRDTFICILQFGLGLVATVVTLSGGVFLHVLFDLYAFGAFGDSGASFDESPDWLWTTLVLLDLQYLVCTCVYAIADIYIEKRLDSRPSIEGAAGACHFATSLFATCAKLTGIYGIMLNLVALVFWTVMSPMPAVAWMAPASMLAANAWIRSTRVDRLCACWMWISQR